MSTSLPHTDQFIDHLFRRQSGKMVAVLTHLFGISELELVEDVVQESFLYALQTWKLRGIPDNAEAWLLQVAKNKAIDHLRRKQYHQRYLQQTANHTAETIDVFFHDQEMADSQLRMIFACCHPKLKEADQLALTLNLVFSFSIAEIARALVTTESQVQKRLFRAKALLKTGEVQLEIPAGASLAGRSETVYTVLYLLFNEGYCSTKADAFIRHDLCMEAMRCCQLLCEHKQTAGPPVFALLALMCFHAARFNSRIDAGDEMILLQHQDRSSWDHELMDVGRRYLEQSADGTFISRYHLEASIAAEHALAKSFDSTNWPRLLFLFDLLVQLYPSPVAMLNRAVVLAETGDIQQAIAAVLHIPGIELLLQTQHLYSAVLGDLYAKLSEQVKALEYFQQAQSLTRSPAEQKLLHQKIAALTQQ